MTAEETLLAEALEHHESNRFSEADAVYRRLAADFPRWAPGLWNYARMLHSFPHIPAALKRAAEMYSATLKADGDFHDIKAEAYNGMGTIMLRLLRPEEAKECFRRTLMLNPNHPHVQVNYGVACRMSGDVAEAGELYEDAIQLNPEDPAARFERALVRLTMGDLPGGFEEYEWRWKCPQFLSARLTTDVPKWNGESLQTATGDGKTILLCYEQGLGDAIMFIRYARLIKERWPSSTVQFWCPPEIVPLHGMIAGVDRIFCSSETHDEPIDYHCPLLSLPRLLRSVTTGEIIQWCGPYITFGGEESPASADRAQMPTGCPDTSGAHMLRAEPAQSTPNGGGSNSLRVAIVWAGRPEHGGDKWRSTNLEQWHDLLTGVEGVQWYSFQMGDRRAQLAEAPNVIDVGRNLRNYRDTAEWLRDMDLVISVDTSIVHLAGAMGKPVWTLLPYSPDWRWLLSGETTAWYPTMRLFRQETKGDWATVFDKVRKELWGLTGKTG